MKTMDPHDLNYLERKLALCKFLDCRFHAFNSIYIYIPVRGVNESQHASFLSSPQEK